MRRPDFELAVDVEFVDIVDDLEEVDVLEFLEFGGDALEGGHVFDDDVDVADDVVGTDPNRADIADVRARGPDGGREPTEKPGAV